MPRAVHRAKHPPSAQLVEPWKVATDPVPRHVHNEMSIEHAAPVSCTGENRPLDSLRVVDAIRQIRVQAVDFMRPVLDLVFHRLLVLRERIAHLQQRLP